jgi:glycosyl hydrolase family 113
MSATTPWSPRLLPLLLLPVLASPAPPPPAKARDLFSRDGRMRGVCFVAGRKIDESVFRPLLKDGVEWISQTPFGYLSAADSPEIVIPPHGEVYWGETDEGIAATARLARQYGIRTLLKPHLWVGGWHEGSWSGDIGMKSAEDWRKWFSSYRDFILHYARLAQANGIEALCVGTELQGATSGHDAEWRALIAEVRKAFTGRITYAANWDHEFEALTFWDALDFAGVQAYFPLSGQSESSVPDLLSGWRPHLAMLQQVSARIGRPVVFTEIGYRSADGAAVQPWLWRTEDRANPEEQARCYEAMFRAAWNQPWFRGLYVWKWFPHRDGRESAGDNSFTPQGKPAEAILGRWYSADGVPARPALPGP